MLIRFYKHLAPLEPERYRARLTIPTIKSAPKRFRAVFFQRCGLIKQIRAR
jgi:hypothetical protein